MPIPGIPQPEYISISPNLRLRRYDGVHDFALEWYRDEETVWLVDGDRKLYDPELLKRMYDYLNEQGEVPPVTEEVSVEVKGRCLMTGLPRTVTINSDEMVEALEEPAEIILEAVHMVIERTDPELVGDISENGIVLSGGGSLLYGMSQLISERTGIEAHVVDDALSCTAYGAGRMLSRLNNRQDGMINLARKRQMKG